MNYNHRRMSSGHFYKGSGDYKPGAISKESKIKPKPNEIPLESKEFILTIIDNSIKKGKTLDEVINLMAKNEKIQFKLADYYFDIKKTRKGLEFDDIIKQIYMERELKRKSAEMDSVR